MNNNDPMKRFGYIVFSICLFALSACTSHEQMDQEEGIVKVSMGLTAASFTDDDATTRAEQPMAPDYENLISNLWILQFDREGILTGSEHKVLPTPVLNTTLEGIALRTGRGTAGVVGNLAQKVQKVLPLPEGFDEAIASTDGVSALYMYLNKLPLPKGLRQNLVQNVQDHVHELGQGVFMTMSESVARVVAEYIWQGMVFVILWLVIAAFIMGGSRLIMHVVHQVPIVGTVDRAAGGVIMLLLVAVTLAVLYNALGVFVGLHAEDNAILAAIGQSKILGGLQSLLQAAVAWKHAG